MSRRFDETDFRRWKNDVLHDMVREARTKPRIAERRAGSIVVMTKSVCEYANHWFFANYFNHGGELRDVELASVFEDGDYFITNAQNELVSTYALAMQKIASCERAVMSGKGFYSGLEDPSLKAENGFTAYPGAVCFQICSDNFNLFTAEELGDAKVGDLIPVMEIYPCVSGGTPVEDLESALASGKSIREFFEHYGYVVKDPGEPPVTSDIITALLAK